MQKILVATDGSDIAGRAVAQAAELSARLGVPLVVVHVATDWPLPEGLAAYGAIEFPESVPHREGDEGPSTWVPGLSGDLGTGSLSAAVDEGILSEAVHAAKSAGAVGVQGRLLEGDAASAIVAAAHEAEADTIVLGSRGQGALRRAVLGSVSEKVLHHTRASVLVVH